MGALKPQSNGSLYSNTMIGTARRGLGGLQFRPVPSSLYQMYQFQGQAVDEWAVAHPSTASVATSGYLVWHYNYLCTLKG